jgi:hypothetical protein
MKQSLLLIISLASSFSALAVTNEQADAIFNKILSAQKAHNYSEFVSDADDKLKAAISQTQFDAASDSLNKRFKDGYDVKFLGDLNQGGFQVFLYRLRCKDGGDDFLATLIIKDGKVDGIRFH